MKTVTIHDKINAKLTPQFEADKLAGKLDKRTPPLMNYFEGYEDYLIISQAPYTYRTLNYLMQAQYGDLTA